MKNTLRTRMLTRMSEAMPMFTWTKTGTWSGIFTRTWTRVGIRPKVSMHTGMKTRTWTRVRANTWTQTRTEVGMSAVPRRMEVRTRTRTRRL